MIRSLLVRGAGGAAIASSAVAAPRPLAAPAVALSRPASLSVHANVQQRHLSFFSQLFGLQQKQLEKKAAEGKVEEKADADKVTKVEERKKTLKATKDYLRQKQSAIKTTKTLSLQEERIIGGNYPVRGPPAPEKRLREWSYTVENLTVTPKKLNLVCKLIRKLPVEEARNQLRYSKKAISRDVLLALDKVCMNARLKGEIHIKDLIVGQCYVGGRIMGHKLDIKARGKSGRITKRVSHLNIVVYENPALVPGFKSRTLLPKEYQQQKRTEYRKRQEEAAKADKEQKGVFKLIA